MRTLLVAGFICFISVIVRGFEAPSLVVQSPSHQESITVRQGESVRLECRGQHSISWTYPTTALEQGRLQVKERYRARRNTYTSQLVLEDASIADIGFYGCRHEVDGNVSDVSSLYIFVADPRELFVSPESMQFIVLGSNRTNIIPCRVTNPSAQVKLVKGREEIALDGDILYDPRVGFSLLYPNIYFNGLFKCKAKLGSKVDVRQFILHYLPDTVRPAPHVIMDNNDLTEGNRLTLTCRTLISADTLMTVNWTKDGQPLESNGRITVSRAKKRIFEHDEVTNGYRYASVKRNVKIPCLLPEDSGEYRCIVEDHNRHISSQAVTVRVSETATRNDGLLCLQP